MSIDQTCKAKTKEQKQDTLMGDQSRSEAELSKSTQHSRITEQKPECQTASTEEVTTDNSNT